MEENSKKMESDNQQLKEELRENNKEMEEKMGEKLEELREDNQLLREELTEVNQENLDKLDERMELLREEMSKELNDNKEYTNKKIEEETMVIKQQIMDIEGKCNQTEREVQKFKEEVNTKFTNIEEHSRRKMEENRRETQEELGKVRNQVAERCDGMEEAMTNITGQVRQSQEEMEVMRNRPNNFTGMPINENREWLNFRQYLSLIHI